METKQDIKTGLSREISEQSNPASFGNIFVKLFTSPTKSFKAIKEKPKVLLPLIIILVISMIITAAIQKFAILMQLDLVAQARNIPPDVLNQIRVSATQISPLKTAIGAITGSVFLVIFTLISAGCSIFIGSVIMGGKTTFKTVLSVTAFAGLINLVGGLVVLPLMYLKESILVSIGLAALLPGKGFTSILYSFLYQYNFFMIWSVIIGGIGYAVIYGFPRSKGIAISIISSFVLAFLAIALRLVGLIMAGIDISFI